MRVAVSGRSLQPHAGQPHPGGGPAYAGPLYERLGALGVDAGVLVPPIVRGPARALAYAVADGLVWPRRCRMDMLHYPGDTGALVPARIPVAATVHGLPPRRPAGPRGAARERLWYRRVGGLLDVADAVITASEFAAREVHRVFGVPARRLHPIPYGLDAARFHPGAGGDAERLAPLRLPPRYVLFLGALAPRKNVPLLVEATARIGVPLVVAGRPAPGDGALARVLDTAPHVRRLGTVPGPLVAPLLRGAAALALPSSHEGSALPVLEAMACGTPAVVSGRGALPEAAGGAARTVPDLSLGSLVFALGQVLGDAGCAAELRDAGLRRVRDLTWERAAARHHEVFSGLVG
ncbi:glycosyltransferase [Actinomadura parmotrematis]|uniref:Glycosyltransferase n=1 Tax=Actinomadura parmotrematis TaxID=2864039 RepID=A0ABS7FM64_9ACTN|nr:glycosyltransferase [Actinomadura parmotrematis]MBW8481459.1 glycosyltransferase [Actinomadura parmotrematis]